MKNITISQIGTIYTPFEHPEGMPIQPKGAIGVEGRITVINEFITGLADLDGFSHIILLYHFHKISRVELSVKPFLDKSDRGVFSTRAPTRPNHIGISVVELMEIAGADLYVKNIDVLNGTPLLDIKPYIPAIDHHSVSKTGWYDKANQDISGTVADKRFT